LASAKGSLPFTGVDLLIAGIVLAGAGIRLRRSATS
jgi:hypothetical protein